MLRPRSRIGAERGQAKANLGLGGGNDVRSGRRTCHRVVVRAKMSPDASVELKDGIAKFYDESSTVWENIWGEHMHHGYYGESNVGQLTIDEHRKAQVLMIDKVLEWAGVTEEPKSILDVGCGIGGSTRHIVRKFSSQYGCGITLSPFQAQRANDITSKLADLTDGREVKFMVADALKQPFEDNTFDLVWSLESGEHMPNKQQFLSELYRVVKPGGRVIIVTWCHRILEVDEASLKSFENLLLSLINRAYFLPDWVSIADYEKIATELGFIDIKLDDWSNEVAPFWTAVLKTAFTPAGMKGLLQSGLKTIRGAAVMPLMRLGFATGTIKFNLFTATKPKL